MADVYDKELYDKMRDRTISLQFHVHDLTEGSQHHERPEAVALRNELHQLREDLELRKHPKTIEDRVKTIQRQLEQAKHQSDPFIHYDHIDDLTDQFKDIRENVRDYIQN